MEKCWREVLERSVIEKCWLSQHKQEMPTNAQLFEYDLFRHLQMNCQVILSCLHLRLFRRSKKYCRKNGHKRTVVSF